QHGRAFRRRRGGHDDGNHCLPSGERWSTVQPKFPPRQQASRRRAPRYELTFNYLHNVEGRRTVPRLIRVRREPHLGVKAVVADWLGSILKQGGVSFGSY